MVKENDFFGRFVGQSLTNFLHALSMSKNVIDKNFDIFNTPNIFSFVFHFISKWVLNKFKTRDKLHRARLLSVNIYFRLWKCKMVCSCSLNVIGGFICVVT